MNLFPPTRQNTFVVIVTYNPDLRLNESLAVIMEIFNNVMIVDNNSSPDIKTMINYEHINFIKNSNNLGIAQALNIGANYAIDKGAKWIMMLDQDTIPRSDILDVFISVYNNYPDKELIGQIGVSFPHLNTKIRPFKEVDVLITSGTLLSLDVFKKAGNFREDFFIDSVDFEYSLRINKMGFVNLLSPETAINHRLGNLKERKILFLRLKSTNHSPLRRYYMARNHVVITFQYLLSFPYWILKKNYFFLRSIFEILLIDDQKMIKIKKTFSGILDGIFYKNPNSKSI